MSVILMYHRVADLHHDPFGLAVHPDHFAAHIEHLQQRGDTVPLEDVLRRGPSGRVAITFDDGYADNATAAAPLVVQAGLPATWFITAGWLGRRRFWWDRLAEALLGAPESTTGMDVEIHGRALWLDLRTSTSRATALHFIHRHLRPLPPETLRLTVHQLVDQFGGLDQPGRDDLTMTVQQLRNLADQPLQEIGAHTRTHIQLHEQTEDLQRSEVLGSVSDLVGLLDRPVRAFAYPFGVPDAIGPIAPRLVEEAGCRLACTTSPGLVHRGSDPFRLPRLYVQDWDGEEFAQRLKAALSRR
ncbi:polysaccharide deacetylase family protein [Geodermatophilus sp. SYSU D00700]